MTRRLLLACMLLLAACGAEDEALVAPGTRELRGTVSSRDEDVGAYLLAEGGSFVLAEDAAIVDTSGSGRDASSLVGSEVRVSCASGSVARCVAQRVAILARGDTSRPKIIEPPALD